MKKSTTEKALFDTNILIYALVGVEPEKQGIARALIEESSRLGKMILSSQVLVETSNVLLNKMKLPAPIVLDLIDDLASTPTVAVNFDLVREALVLATLAKINFWDALIVESACGAGCSVLYTEDLSHGQVIRGVKVVNPFL